MEIVMPVVTETDEFDFEEESKIRAVSRTFSFLKY